MRGLGQETDPVACSLAELERSTPLRLTQRITSPFDRRASAYAQLVDHFNSEVGAALAQGLPSESHGVWVDLGSGTGAMTRLVQGRYPRAMVLGVDRSRRMLAEARRLTPEGAPTWYVEADVGKLPWPPSLFSGVTALLSLHLVEELPALLVAVRRALQPDGILAVALSSADNPWFRFLAQNVMGGVPFFRHGTPGILRVLEETGFSVVSRPFTQPLPVSGDQLRAMMGAIGPVASRGLRPDAPIPDRMVRQFLLVYATPMD